MLCASASVRRDDPIHIETNVVFGGLFHVVHTATGKKRVYNSSTSKLPSTGPGVLENKTFTLNVRMLPYLPDQGQTTDRLAVLDEVVVASYPQQCRK